WRYNALPDSGLQPLALQLGFECRGRAAARNFEDTMKYRRSLTVGSLTVALACVLSVATRATRSDQADASGLSGSITANGAPIEGVTVSAKAAGSTVTTTVFTDDHGVYRFPTLPPGAYKVWAQTTGYQTVRADARFAEGPPPRQDFTLK